MKRSRFLYALMAVVVVLSLVAACAPAPTPTPTPVPPTPTPKEPYKIGVCVTLTGPLAQPGLEFRDGIVLEVERINAAGGIDGHRIELIIEDDGGDPTRVATALTKLIRQDQVLAVIGPWGSFLEPSSRPVTEREQVPQIIGSPTMAEMRAKNFRWSFNLSPNEIIAAEAVLEILKDKGYKKAVVVNDTTDLMTAMSQKLQADGPHEGIQMVALPDTLGFRDVDVTPQLTKLKELIAKEKPEAVVLLATIAAVPFVKGAKQLGIDLPIVGSHGLGSPMILQLFGNDANGMLIPGLRSVMPEQLPDSDPQKAVILDFYQRFQEKYGRVPGIGQGADAVNILANALKVAGPDRAGIREAIENTKNFIGVTGVFNYSPDDHEGLTKEAMAIYEVKEGKFVLVRTIQ